MVRVDFSLSPDLQPGTQVPSLGQSWPSAWDSSPSLSQSRPLAGTVNTQSLPVPFSSIQSHVWPCHVAVVTLILMPNMPKTECIARIRRKPMDNVRWCVHNKCQQVDLRQYWVVFCQFSRPVLVFRLGLKSQSRAVLAFGLGLQSQSIPVPAFGRHCQDPVPSSPSLWLGPLAPVPASGRQTGGQSQSAPALCVAWR